MKPKIVKPEEEFDLYEIVVHVDLEGVRARLEKYRVYKTGLHFMKVSMINRKDLEENGYSYRMDGRIKIEVLMQVQRIGFGDGCDHVYRHIYCLPEQKQEALDKLRKEIQQTVERFKDNVTKLHHNWFNRDNAIQEKKKGPRRDRQASKVSQPTGGAPDEPGQADQAASVQH